LDSRSCQECSLVKPSVTSLLYLSIYILASYNRYDIALLLYMFSIILFIVYFDYMPSIVSNIRSYSAHSLTSWVSGQHRVIMELRRCLPANAPYIPGHVVDRESDTLVESFVVHSPNIGQSRTWLRRKTCSVPDLP
jgi:hypothetical protein